MAGVRLRREDYTVGWICALPIEFAAAQELLDDEHQDVGRASTDNNVYALGRMGMHNIVIACLPAGQTGTNSAAVVAMQMQSTFKAIRFGLLVGIGGGVPSANNDVRLGDVVVSQPYEGHGGVVQYDFGKTGPSTILRTGFLNTPPSILLSAIAKVKATYFRKRGAIETHLLKLAHLTEFARESAGPDILFDATYDHEGGDDCSSCLSDRVVDRPQREDSRLRIHYGTIASGNQFMKNASERDRISNDFGGVLCFEMEAAGLMNAFPCLVIRGICDYSDSHKNKRWQPFAAGTAAAYAKELLSLVPTDELTEVRTVDQIMADEMGPTRTPEEITALKQKLLQSLSFAGMNRRRDDILDAANETCKWFEKHSTHAEWIQAQSSLLWVKGKPGAGKSTLMKFAIRHSIPHNVVTASYFFNGRGSVLEKTPLGFYRSILHQLFPSSPKLHEKFALLYEERCKTNGDVGNHWDWHEGELKYWTEELLLNISAKPVRLYVDALDESGEEAACQLIDYLQGLVQKSSLIGNTLGICFSCRHYPIVALDGLTICVEHENSADIYRYVHGKLSAASIKRDSALTLAEEVIERANGVFQWVTIVLPQVINKCRRGIPTEAIRREIRKLPRQLHNLYSEILSGITEDERSLSLRLMQWICFALRPLSVEALDVAMVVHRDTPYLTLYEALENDRLAENEDDMVRRITDLSRGLAEVKDHDGERRVVQLIHQSVWDYLVEGGLRLLYDSVVSDQLDLRAQAHLSLAWSCVRYLAMYDFGDDSTSDEDDDNSSEVEYFEGDEDTWPSWGNKSREKRRAKEKRIKELIADHDHGGLLDYTKDQWISHVLQAERLHTCHKELLEIFLVFHQSCARVFERWRDLQIRTSTHPLEYKNTTMLHILIQKRLSRILNDFLKATNPDANLKNFVGLTPLALAAQIGDEEAARHLLAFGVDANLGDEWNLSPLSWAARKGHTRVVRLLVEDPSVDEDFRDKNNQTPLSLAAENGHKALVEFFLSRGKARPASQDKWSQTPLHWAALEGRANVVPLLLAHHDVNPNARDRWENTPLLSAARDDRCEAVRALIAHKSVNVNAQDVQGRNSLIWAIANGNAEMVKLLLSREDIWLEESCPKHYEYILEGNQHVSNARAARQRAALAAAAADYYQPWPVSPRSDRRLKRTRTHISRSIIMENGGGDEEEEVIIIEETSEQEPNQEKLPRPSSAEQQQQQQQQQQQPDVQTPPQAADLVTS